MIECKCDESDHCPLHAKFPEDERVAPHDATMSARVEMAAAMLLLEDPLQLLEALAQAGLGVQLLQNASRYSSMPRPFALQCEELGGQPLLPNHLRAAQSRIARGLGLRREPPPDEGMSAARLAHIEREIEIAVRVRGSQLGGIASELVDEIRRLHAERVKAP